MNAKRVVGVLILVATLGCVGLQDPTETLTPVLDITRPNAASHWPVNSARQIQWTTTGTVSHVDLAYSSDGFATHDDIAAGVANTGLYTWTTPLSATTSAQIRIQSVLSPTTVYDVSEMFALYDPSTFTHTVYTPVVLNDYTSPVADHRVYSTNLVYQGAFAYPAGDEWAYSGHALAYYPDGDPSGSSDGYPGSLYAAAHPWDDLVGEMSIPAPVVSASFDDLPQASVLRPLADITAGWKDNCTYHPECIYREVDGLEYLPNVDKIAWNLRDWYNVVGYDQDSLGWSELDMTGAQGVWHIGERPSAEDLFHNAKACDYLFKAPESFADENLDGKWLIAGNHREGGALGGSQGPTLYALAPWEDGNPPTPAQNLDALALLYYPEIYDCVWTDPEVCHFAGYRAADDWGGGAWVQTATRSAILIFGRKGLGDSCYGTPEECGGDPCITSKGYHAYPYAPQILFYDPEELKDVLVGIREPWEVLPYEVYSPVDEVLVPGCAVLGAAAYDQTRGFLYVAEQEAGPWGETVIHVWRIE